MCSVGNGGLFPVVLIPKTEYKELNGHDIPSERLRDISVFRVRL